MYEEYASHDIAAYAAYIDDDKELLECTSGGMGTALARQVIKEGGYVAGVSYSEDFRRARYEIINDLKDIDRFKGSKYITPDKGTIYADIKKLLDEGKKVLFFGLPCAVAALRSSLGQDYDNLIAADIICHGTTPRKVHEQYVKYLEDKYQSKITELSVRHKVDTWKPANMYARFANGKTFVEGFYRTEYGYAFNRMSNPGCYDCRFRGNSRTGDIMIGDCWGATRKDPFWNDKGISAVLVHTGKGKELVRRTEGIRLYETTFERIVRSNLNVIRTKPQTDKGKKLEALLTDHDLFYAVKHTMGLWGIIGNEFIRRFPKSLRPWARGVYMYVKRLSHKR